MRRSTLTTLALHGALTAAACAPSSAPQSDVVRAVNAASSLQATFAPDGARLASRDTGWSARVRLERFGRAGAMATASDAAAVAEGDRVTFARAPGLTEWYVNGAGGLEHGFTLERRPAGDGDTLRFEVSLEGARAAALPDGALALDSGAATMRYEDLRVWDATGRHLDASMRPGAAGFVVEVDDAGATYPVTVDPTFVREQKLTPSDSATGWYAEALAFDGVTLAVGAPFRDASAQTQRAGAVYLYARDPQGDWVEVDILTPSDAEGGDEFGWSVALSGDRLLVGAKVGDAANADDTGAAYLFERDAQGAWSEVAKLAANDPDVGDEFGHAVALDGDRAVVGAIGGSRAGIDDTGAAYVFELDPQGAWGQIAKLTADDTLADERFGFAVALDGDRVAVGAPYHDIGTATEAGAVYVFERGPQSAWPTAAKLTYESVGNVVFGQNLGCDVALDGDRIFAGACEYLTGGPGLALIFERDPAGAWSRAAALSASDGAGSDQFGERLDASGDVLVVGAPQHNAGAIDSGAAYVFERDAAGLWAEATKLSPSDPSRRALFGHDVALARDAVAIGAYFDDAAYIFSPELLIANDDAVTTPEDTPITIDVLVNDATSGAPSVTSTSGFDQGGAATVDAQDRVVYTPAADFTGTETFEYDVTQGAATATATVTVTVTPVDDPPAFVDPTPADGDSIQVVAGDTLTFVVAATDVDDVAADLTLEVTSLPEGATFDAAAGTFAWVTDPDDAGTYPLTLAASDETTRVTREVTLEVSSQGDVDAGHGAPDAGAGADAGSDEDAGDGAQDAGVGGADAASPGGGGATPSEGCCATAPSTPTRAPIALLLMIAGAAALTRRRATAPRAAA
jgi:hypothetical protein